ncbi:Dihydroflavonol-4-reductase protein [Spatholobus suberectus]|nr:Dihydroflavonol-4-reductase protein [Spatholobus suberectus]
MRFLERSSSHHVQPGKADLAEEGSFDEAIQGCTRVFHLATPTDFESKGPKNEVIKPAIKGLVGIMKACLNSKGGIHILRRSCYRYRHWLRKKHGKLPKRTTWISSPLYPLS